MSSVLIIENDDLMRLSLRVIIEKVSPGMDIVDMQNFRDSVDLLGAHRFDLVILETPADQGSGIRMLEEIRRRDPAVAVLVCSVGEEKLQAERYLLKGANGFIVKSASPEDILTAISMVLKGKRYLSQQIHADILSRNLPIEVYKHPLTKRENQVMILTLQGKSTSEIADALSIHRNTVSAFKAKILRKMQVNSVVDLIHMFRRRSQASLTSTKPQGVDPEIGIVK